MRPTQKIWGLLAVRAPSNMFSDSIAAAPTETFTAALLLNAAEAELPSHVKRNTPLALTVIVPPPPVVADPLATADRLVPLVKTCNVLFAEVADAFAKRVLPVNTLLVILQTQNNENWFPASIKRLFPPIDCEPRFIHWLVPLKARAAFPPMPVELIVGWLAPVVWFHFWPFIALHRHSVTPVSVV
jgi:hypothetical protein